MKNYKTVLPLLILIALLTVSLLCVLLTKETPQNENRLTVDKNAVDIGTPHSDGTETAGEGKISIPGFERLTVQAGKKVVGCNIFNPSENRCYFVAVVSLEDGTEIFRSGLIPPGKAIYSMTLQEPLGAGYYQAALSYLCYSLDGMGELNGATIHFILEVTP